MTSCFNKILQRSLSSREFLIDWVPWVPNRLEKFVVIGVNTASAFKFGLESFGVELYQ